jgi:hypothetical protein
MVSWVAYVRFLIRFKVSYYHSVRANSQKGIQNYHLQKMRDFLVDGFDFDRIDDRDLIGIFVEGLIGYQIRTFIFLKDRDWSGK